MQTANLLLTAISSTTGAIATSSVPLWEALAGLFFTLFVLYLIIGGFAHAARIAFK